MKNLSSSVSYISNQSGYVEYKDNVYALDEKTGKFVFTPAPNITNVRSDIRKSHRMNYSTDRELALNMDLSTIISRMNSTVNLPNSDETFGSTFSKMSKMYNRFKMANPNIALQRGYAHVFFVRPKCNIMNSSATGLIKELRNSDIFQYAWKSSPDLIRELTIKNGYKHDFMMSLSNFSNSFSLNDEFIENNTYGTTFTGYKIAYGKNNISSKTAGNFTITYSDDRNFHIYQLHRLWVEYINGVFRGTIVPLVADVFNKILDYTSAVYYILTAEDGETIIFWSKYYGVFPTTIPAGQYSWAAGNIITNPTIDIEYQYSFKEDFNPYTINEFNYNSRVESNGTKYVPVFDRKLNQVGTTWVGAPFIELHKGDGGIYEYKLRFREK